MDTGNTETSQDMEFRGDQAFKDVIHNCNVLSMLLREFVTHFSGMRIEDIKEYLDLGADGVTVNDLNTELRNENGHVSLDALFKVRTPAGGTSYIFVGIEGQQYYDDFPALMDRAVEYAASEITRQRGLEFTERDGNSLRDVWSIWVITKPKSVYRNSIVDYTLNGRIRCSKNDYNVYQTSKINIVFVNTGDISDGLPEEIEIPSAMFYSDMDYRDRMSIMDKYKFGVDEYVERGIRMMHSMTDEAYKVGRKDMAREDAISHVSALMRRGFSMGEAFDMLEIDEKMREYVRTHIDD